ncbi:plexin domain-containing protein 2 isoform X2 [Atheta coriaria]|uniref:plexin domain-containing protein 2 isoform X2 n=1 Tax=Dalotia coriaria TaxID=877792 RepID=UPI0031F36A56
MTEPTPQAKEMKESKTPKKVVSVFPNVHVEEDDEVSINKFADPSFNFNKTLQENNISTMQNDTHIYYNSSFRVDDTASKLFWVDVDKKVDMKISDLLSKSHRRAATVRLSFDFPFYGHYIRNVTIATGGFLYTGDYVHSWLAATQYIAPLMANFDTSLSNDSYIKYVDNKTAFTVLWENVVLQDKPDDGKFTFQTTLHSNGDIVFVYQNVPLIIENIQDRHHPVKIGLSDAYIIDRTIFFMRRKTIYEYHRVNFRKEDIKNGTVIYLSALATCPILKNCTACLTKSLANFQCSWCPSLNKCSNGLDRSRQEWLTKGCDKRQVKNDSECGQPYSEALPDDHEVAFNNHDSSFDPLDDPTKGSRVSDVLSPDSQAVRMGVSSVMAILFLVSLLSGIVIWVFYAFRNPHTTSGQILIRLTRKVRSISGK